MSFRIFNTGITAADREEAKKLQAPEDPCKAWACVVQQCYMDMQGKIPPGLAYNDKHWCVEERERLNMCRESYALPGTKAARAKAAGAELPPPDPTLAGLCPISTPSPSVPKAK